MEEKYFENIKKINDIESFIKVAYANVNTKSYLLVKRQEVILKKINNSGRNSENDKEMVNIQKEAMILKGALQTLNELKEVIDAKGYGKENKT